MFAQDVMQQLDKVDELIREKLTKREELNLSNYEHTALYMARRFVQDAITEILKHQ